MDETSSAVIGCRCEAGIDYMLAPEATPDGRPGVLTLFFFMSASCLGAFVPRLMRTFYTDGVDGATAQ